MLRGEKCLISEQFLFCLFVFFKKKEASRTVSSKKLLQNNSYSEFLRGVVHLILQFNTEFPFNSGIQFEAHRTLLYYPGIIIHLHK